MTMIKRDPNHDFTEYVEHPRFGKGPRFTGLDPNPHSFNTRVWYSPSDRPFPTSISELLAKWGSVFRKDQARVISGTAIKAGPTTQISYYFDIDKVCKDCRRHFIFFAEEQKHWYEELGFYEWADAVRCTDCRKKQHDIDRLHRRYQELLKLPSLNTEESFEFVECGLTLVEQSVYGKRALDKVRMVFKRIPEDKHHAKRLEALKERLQALGSGKTGDLEVNGGE